MEIPITLKEEGPTPSLEPSRELVLLLSVREQKALAELTELTGLSWNQVLRQGLRTYQLVVKGKAQLKLEKDRKKNKKKKKQINLVTAETAESSVVEEVAREIGYEERFRNVIEHSLLYSKFARICQRVYQEGVRAGIRQEQELHQHIAEQQRRLEELNRMLQTMQDAKVAHTAEHS